MHDDTRELIERLGQRGFDGEQSANKSDSSLFCKQFENVILEARSKLVLSTRVAAQL